MRTTAIVLAGGQGKRMGSDVAKQYLLLRGKPVLYYTLKNFEESVIDDVILVTMEGQEEYCKKEIVEAFGFQKVRAIVHGGKERYHSVACGLNEIERLCNREAGYSCDYVFIHDGARLFATKEILQRGLLAVEQYKACVIGMPVKDTIKIADEEGYCDTTPNRNLVWQIQTPQIFDFSLIKKAYDELLMKEHEIKGKGIVVTDDAMVLELFSDHKIKFVKGSYENIKLTTPDDLLICESILNQQEKS